MNTSRTNSTASASQVPHLSASMSHYDATAAVAPVLASGKPAMASELIEIADDLANKLIECQAFSAAWLIQAGAILTTYQSQLPRGDMTFIYASGRLPLSQRYGQMLSAIARNSALRDPAMLKQIPTAIQSLALLAPLGPGLIRNAVRDGFLHRRLTQHETADVSRKLKQQS